MKVQWVGGPQDGGMVDVAEGVTWVTVLEDRRASAPIPPAEPDGTKPPRSLMRYSVPIIDGRIIWAQRVQADPKDGEI